MIAYIAAMIALLGLILYIVSTNGKVAEIGRILFFCGALVTLLALGQRTVKLF